MEPDIFASDWEWIYNPSAATTELAGMLPGLLKDAQEIKRNPKRKVFRTPKYYIKVDFRRGCHLKKEWNCAMAVQEKGLPMVEHLAYGKSSIGEMVVTRALEGAVSIRDWLSDQEKEAVDEVRLAQIAHRYAQLIRQVVEAGMYHPDFHTGNVLMEQGVGKMFLVDVNGVRRAKVKERLQFWRMYSNLLTFNRFYLKEQIIRLLEVAGVPDGKKMWKEIQRKSIRHLLFDWKNRSWQMLNPPSRYTDRAGEWLRFVDVSGQSLKSDNQIQVQAPSVEAARKRCLADFLLERARIPHRRLLAWRQGTTDMLLEAVNTREAEQVPDEFSERLGLLGIRTTPRQWGAKENGEVIMTDLTMVEDFPMLDLCSMRGPLRRAYVMVKTMLGFLFSA